MWTFRFTTVTLTAWDFIRLLSSYLPFAFVFRRQESVDLTTPTRLPHNITASVAGQRSYRASGAHSQHRLAAEHRRGAWGLRVRRWWSSLTATRADGWCCHCRRSGCRQPREIEVRRSCYNVPSPLLPEAAFRTSNLAMFSFPLASILICRGASGSCILWLFRSSHRHVFHTVNRVYNFRWRQFGSLISPPCQQTPAVRIELWRCMLTILARYVQFTLTALSLFLPLSGDLHVDKLAIWTAMFGH